MLYYTGLVKTTLKEAVTYRVNFFFSFLVEFIPILGFIFLVKYIYGSHHQIGSYTYSKALSYYVFVRFFSDLFMPVSWWDIVNDIRTGNLSNHLIKPYSYFWHNFFVFYSLKIIYYLMATFVLVIIIAIFHKQLFFPTNIMTYFYFVIAVILSIVLAFQLSFLLSITNFFLIDNSFVDNLFEILLPILAGTLIPLDVFPKVIYVIFSFLPFKCLIYLPTTIFLENYNMESIISLFLQQIIWILLLYLIIKSVWKKGLKVYEAVN